MKYLLICFFLLFQVANCNGQNCNCLFDGYPDSIKPIKIFSFKNNQTIGLFGDKNTEGNDTLYNGIALYLCNHKRIVFDMINFGMISYEVKKTKDTLVVEEIEGLPVGKNYEVVWKSFYIRKFFFKDKDLIEIGRYRNDIRKYTKPQIAEVLQSYKKITKGNDCDGIIEEANKLFWATVSGSKEAETCFKSLPKKFGPFDGACGEDWDDLIATYEHWKQKNRRF